MDSFMRSQWSSSEHAYMSVATSRSRMRTLKFNI